MKDLVKLPQERKQRLAALPTSIQALQMEPQWRLFPVQSHNRFMSAKARVADATADLARLEQWACEFPGCNWALATGASSGVFVLQVNARCAGSTLRVLDDDWSWQTLLMSAGDIIGFSFFRWPAGRAMCRKNLGPGMRVFGDDDYVLIPPSVGASGIPHLYWDPEAAIAAAPQWLIDSVFTGLEKRSSGRVVAFPKLSWHASTTTRPQGSSSCDKVLPFVAQVCPSDPRHRVHVYMSFEFGRGRWLCRFLERDMRTLLPRTLNLATADEVTALAGRGGGLSNQEVRQALSLAIANGRGGVFLSLTAHQYSRLQMHCRPAGPKAG